MRPEFPKSAKDTRTLALQLVEHLRSRMTDTKDQSSWSLVNFQALASFGWSGGPLVNLPPDPASTKGGFLWDFIAYAPGKGILIAAESEWKRDLKALQHDFEKLLYVRSPLKVMLFWTDKSSSSEDVVEGLQSYMADCVDDYSPAEVFILYGRTWKDAEGKNDDRVWILQVDGEPAHRSLGQTRFERVA